MYNQFTIRQKLLFVLGLVLLLMAVMAAVTLQKLNVIEHDLVEVVEDLSPEMALAGELAKLSQESARQAYQRLLSNDTTLHDKMQAQRQQTAQTLAALQQRETHPEGVRLLNSVQQSYQQLAQSEQQFELLLQQDKAGASAWLGSQLGPQSELLLGQLAQLTRFQRSEMTRAESEAMASYQQARNTLLVTGSLSLLLGGTLSWLFAARLTRSLRLTVAETQRIAAGDLSPRPSPLPPQNHDEALQLAHATESMRGQLADTLQHIRQAADAVSDASHELSGMSEQVAVSVEQQADATSSASATLEELTVSINVVSGNAEAAADNARTAGKLAAEGGSAVRASLQLIHGVHGSVEQTGNALDGLREEVRAIDSIVTVIREVADQTNLLALNASIEAARAGEAGRGFAVVADEVRKLAERTASATGDITGMISRIQQGVGTVVTQMAQNRSQMAQVDEAASASSETILASQQQSRGAEQSVSAINAALTEQREASQMLARNMEQVAQMAEENSATVEELATTSSQLSELAGSMHQLVGRFRLA
jgi:methyl-accepting chemotaxis protein